jgi:hypothetical protein
MDWINQSSQALAELRHLFKRLDMLLVRHVVAGAVVDARTSPVMFRAGKEFDGIGAVSFLPDIDPIKGLHPASHRLS